jgi:DNA-directed RNA polymerase subunit L
LSFVQSLFGRIEYDPYSIENYNYCILRLCLYDIPHDAEVKITTTREWKDGKRCEERSNTRISKVFEEKADRIKIFHLGVHGRIRVEICTKKHVHFVEYRIDEKQKKPIRSMRSKLEIDVEDKLRDESDFLQRRIASVQSFDAPDNSLWSS